MARTTYVPALSRLASKPCRRRVSVAQVVERLPLGKEVAGSSPVWGNMGYLIWSFQHMKWWRPNGRGYTSEIDEAGRYPQEEAGLYVLDDVLHNEIAIPEPNALRDGPPKFHPYEGLK